MTIKRVLKDYTWEFDLDKKVLILNRDLYGVQEQLTFEMDKIRMLSLMRFMVRVLARLSIHKRNKAVQ